MMNVQVIILLLIGAIGLTAGGLAMYSVRREKKRNRG
jgi:hypothetical protein